MALAIVLAVHARRPCVSSSPVTSASRDYRSTLLSMRTDVFTKVSLAGRATQPYTGRLLLLNAGFENKRRVRPTAARVTFCPCRLECYRLLVLGQARLRLIGSLEAFLQGLHLRNTDGFRTLVGHSLVFLIVFCALFLKGTLRCLSVPGKSTIRREANLTTWSKGTIVVSTNTYMGCYGGGMFPR